MEKKTLKLEDVLAGIGPIVQDNPQFTYPQQGNGDVDERCACIEVEQDEESEYYEENFIIKDCQWHLDDDNTCRYVQKDGSPACVVGHYFVKELGFDDLYDFEAKAPTFILEEHGFDVPPETQRFLNAIQSSQDQGRDWDYAYNIAVGEVERYFAQAEVPYAEE